MQDNIDPRNVDLVAITKIAEKQISDVIELAPDYLGTFTPATSVTHDLCRILKCSLAKLLIRQLQIMP